jgi:SagB-type dehydrogenase family enzyme
MNEKIENRRDFLKFALATPLVFLPFGVACSQNRQQKDKTVDKIKGVKFDLPQPKTDGKISAEKAINSRRSRRRYKNQLITIKQLSQILWAAQGITDKKRGFRAAPSAGALYPMEVFAVVPEGVYRYIPSTHSLKRITKGDKRKALAKVCLNQDWVEKCSVDIVISAVYGRCSIKYGKRAQRYCMIEAGAIGENIYIQVEALKLGTVMVGAYYDNDVQKVLKLKKREKPLLVMPVGIPA